MDDLGFRKDKYVFASMSPMLLMGDSVEENRNKQIASFLNELSTHNVLIKDLVNFPISERDRNIALNVALYITNNEDLLEIVINKKDLPILKVSKLTKLKPDYLEKCRDYIIAYYIIIINPKYKSIQDYFNIKLKEDNNITRMPNKDQRVHKGVTIKTFRGRAYILTFRGEFLKIKPNSEVKIGEACEGKEKKFLGNFKIHISILLVILIMIGSCIVIEYRRTQSIIVIETTSSIKIHINRLNKVIYMYSPTDKGRELIDHIDILNRDVDEATAKIFEYAFNNDMIDPNKKVLITINGQPIKYGSFTKTNKFISENNIPVIINNSGNQQKLPKY